MNIGVILPSTKLYGGVKRFFELGAIFNNRGHQFSIFTPEGSPPEWTKFNGEVLTTNEIENYQLDAIFFTEIQFIDVIIKADAKRKIFYFVRPTDKLNRFLKKHPEIEVFANSTTNYNMAKKKFKIEPVKAFGGINIKQFPEYSYKEKKGNEPIKVMCFGRLSEKRKGTAIVVKACEKLYKKGHNIKLILFDTPVNQKMQDALDTFTCKVPHEFIVSHPVKDNNSLYRKADIFVAAERKTGYSNTAVEAMASGIPVIGTESGTQDFLFDAETGLVVKRTPSKISKAILKLANNEELRKTFSEKGREKVNELDWHNLADKIESELINK